tara:strand:+ start:15400 stop:17808 length:2409 start_codon:yes stop_codon:yes gene_type:complete
MARKETVFKMSIDDSNSIKTLKDLDKNTTRLKKSMDDLADSGDELSDEFKSVNTAYEETIESQKRLMGDMEHLGDDILVEVSGSISKMEDRLYELALAGDTTSKEFVDLQRKTASYKAIIIETDRSVDALAEQGRGLSSALAIGSGAVAGFQAFTGVTALLGDENEELLQTIVKLQAAEGVLNSIEVIKQQLQANSIKLTQARTAIQKAYNVAIGNGTKATKLFRGALLATGIGAIIVGIGLLIENWDKLTASISGSSKAQKLNNEVSSMAIDSYSEQASAADQLIKVINNENTTRAEQVTAVKNLQEKYPDLLSNIDAESASVEEVNKAIALNIKLLKLKSEVEAINSLRADKYKLQLQEQMDVQTGANVSVLDAVTTNYLYGSAQETANKNSRETIKGYKKETAALDDLLAKKQEAIDKAMKEGAVDGKDKPKPKSGGGGGGGKSAAQTRIEEETKAALELSLLQEELRRMTLDALELEELAIADKFDRLAERAGNNAATLKQINEQQATELNALFQKRKDAEQAIQDGIDQSNIDKKNAFLLELEQLEDKSTRTKEQNEINAITDKYFNLRTLAEQYGEETKIIDEQERAELEALEKEHSDRLVAIKKQETDERNALQNKYLDNAAGGLNALSSLNELVSGIAMDQAEGDAKKKEEIARKQFNVNKALQLGLAAIDGFKAINASLTTSPLTILGVPNPGALGALVTTASMSAINIAKIAATKYKGSTSKPSVSGISSSGSAGSGAGSFNISDDTSSAQTNLNPDGTPSQQNQTTQVVVSEIDISNVQNGIEAIETKSTF